MPAGKCGPNIFLKVKDLIKLHVISGKHELMYFICAGIHLLGSGDGNVNYAHLIVAPGIGKGAYHLINNIADPDFLAHSLLFTKQVFANDVPDDSYFTAFPDVSRVEISAVLQDVSFDEAAIRMNRTNSEGKVLPGVGNGCIS